MIQLICSTIPFRDSSSISNNTASTTVSAFALGIFAVISVNGLPSSFSAKSEANSVSGSDEIYGQIIVNNKAFQNSLTSTI